MLFSINPDINKAGDARRPAAVPESSGLSEKMREDTVILPFNDLKHALKFLQNVRMKSPQLLWSRYLAAPFRRQRIL